MHDQGEKLSPVLLIGGMFKDSLAVHGMVRSLSSECGWSIDEERLKTIGVKTQPDSGVALILLGGKNQYKSDNLRVLFPHALIVGLGKNCMEGSSNSGCDLYFREILPGRVAPLLKHAAHYWESQQIAKAHFADLGLKQKQLTQLTDIGLVLGAQVEPDKLLATILTEARAIANCDAGSLYLVDESGQEPMLAFKLAQNDTLDLTFTETLIPLSDKSLAGYVALTGKELSVSDAYQISDVESYEFNRIFDEQQGYRTQSLMVLPMRDHRDCVIGVIQFINRKTSTGEIVPFDAETTEMLRAIASQAAIAIQKNRLLDDINQLFESFVQASVKAVEQRDPSTSGHSFRVAETTTTLLMDLTRSDIKRFSKLEVSEDHLREVRYAALLHDFGKVSVREAVLLKANKLSDDRLETLRFRFELKKEQIRRAAVERELELFHHSPVDVQVIRKRIHRDLETQLSQLSDYFDAVTRANKPKVLPTGDFQHLHKIHKMEFIETDGQNSGLITANDLKQLSIPRGSLSEDERLEIQDHVMHTMEFLAVLPWTPELAGVPEIAGAHHEKMNGTGYPLGLEGEEIPLASRVMTVCDIYDALTAMDRPYKSAMSRDTALRILDEEVSAGLLDADLVKVFQEAQSWRVLGSSEQNKRKTSALATG